ncbi:MAG: response regulator [Burkholderiaceae bacterium]
MKAQEDAAAPVLYVEDHPVNVLLMEALFARRSSARLVVATTGGEALKLSASLRPALLLIDLRLPDCHGAQLLQWLRQRPGWAQIPAIAVTAEHGFKIEGTGFADLWPKPLNLAWVAGRLDQLLPAPARAPSPSPAMPVPQLERAGRAQPGQWSAAIL